MLTGVENYYRPKSIREALNLAANASRKNVFLGGGSILALSNSPGIEGLIDLGDLAFEKIKDGEDRLVIGAGCTMRKIQKSVEGDKYFSRILAQSAGNYLTALLRNQARLGGILAAAFNADIIGALLALEASVYIQTLDGEKNYPLEEIYHKNPYSYFDNAIVTKVSIPKQEQRSAYCRLAKTATDISIISVFVCKIENRLRVAINAGCHLPVMLKGVDMDNIDVCVNGLDTISDIRASAKYRKEMAKVLLKRAIAKLEGQ